MERTYPERIGPYAVDGVLGKGGMGVVFAARAPVEDQAVAVKVSRSFADVTSDLERLREARLLATLRHRHVARLLDVGRLSESTEVAGVPLTAGSGWMVLERLGPTLWQVPPRSQHEAVTVLLQLLDALAHTHAASVLHLDLTPRNLLWRRPGEIVVSDFGLGLGPGWAGRLGGTPAYMAPELAERRAALLGPWTDLYSVGVIASAWLPAEASPWLDRMLARWPLDRYDSALSASECLLALRLDGSRFRRRRLPPAEETVPWTQLEATPAGHPVRLAPSGRDPHPVPQRPWPLEPPRRPRRDLKRRGLDHGLLADPELEARDASLREAWTHIGTALASDDGPSTPAVFIGFLGAAGAGASRMVHDLCTAAAQALGTTPLRHAGTAVAPNAMFALSSMVKSWLNLPAGASSSEGDVAARLGGVPARIRALARALLAASEGRFAGVGPAALAAAWWRQLAEVGPVVVALDDLRAAPELARALRLLSGRRTPHPLIVVASDGAQLPAPAALIPLPPLPSAAVRRLLHRVMRVSDTVAHEIVRESGGQPGAAVRRLREWARGETGLAAATPVPETSFHDPSRLLDAARDALADQVPERALALLGNAATPAAIALRAETWHALGEPARAETDAATALAAPDLPWASRLALERLRVLIALSVGDRALAEARLRGVSATDDPIEAVRTDILAGRLSIILGQYEDAVLRLTRAAVAAEGLERARTGERPGALLMAAWTYLAHAYAGTRDVARLEALAERAARHPDATDQVRLQISTPLGDCLREAGDLAGAIAAHEAALEWALPGSPITAYTLGNLAFLHMLCDDVVRSEEAAVEGLLQLPSGEMTRARCFLTAVRLPALSASGRLAEVARDLELIDRFTARGITLVEVVTSLDRAAAAPMPLELRAALTRSRDAATRLLR